ncbi:unnamed protein product, partial [Ilex paraguariensis]
SRPTFCTQVTTHSSGEERSKVSRVVVLGCRAKGELETTLEQKAQVFQQLIATTTSEISLRDQLRLRKNELVDVQVENMDLTTQLVQSHKSIADLEDSLGV